MPLVEHSRMVSLLGLTARLPADAVDDRPRLLMAVAWANSLLQRADAAQHALDHLRRAMLVGGAHEEMHSEADVVQACIDVYGDRIDRAETLVRQEPGPAPDLPAVDRRGRGQHPDVLRHLLDALPGRAGAPAVGPAVPRPHDRAVRRRLRAVLRGRRRVRPARPRRGRGAPAPARSCSARESAGRRSHAAQLAGRAAGRAALRTRRARRGRAAAGGEPGAGRGERGRRLHGRELRRPRADQGAPRRRRRGRAARRGREGRRAARPHRGCRPPSSPNGSASSWPRGGCARPAGWRRTCPTARPAPAGSAWSSTRSAPGRWPRCCPPRATTRGRRRCWRS